MNLRDSQLKFMSYRTQKELKVSEQSGFYLGYFDFFFSESVSELDCKKSPVQVYVIANFK